MAAYKIGNFTFDTEEEYARGLEDAKKIEKIQSTVAPFAGVEGGGGREREL